jgi:hypothetical protein
MYQQASMTLLYHLSVITPMFLFYQWLLGLERKDGRYAAIVLFGND